VQCHLTRPAAIKEIIGARLVVDDFDAARA
jgi:hypothetical protein